MTEHEERARVRERERIKKDCKPGVSKGCLMGTGVPRTSNEQYTLLAEKQLLVLIDEAESKAYLEISGSCLDIFGFQDWPGELSTGAKSRTTSQTRLPAVQILVQLDKTLAWRLNWLTPFRLEARPEEAPEKAKVGSTRSLRVYTETMTGPKMEIDMVGTLPKTIMEVEHDPARELSSRDSYGSVPLSPSLTLVIGEKLLLTV